MTKGQPGTSEEHALALLVGVTRTLADADEVTEALSRAMDLACRHGGWAVGHAYLPAGDGVLAPSEVWWADSDVYADFRAHTMRTPLRTGEGLPGRVLAEQRSVWLAPLAEAPGFIRRDSACAAGLRGALGVPLLMQGRVAGVLEFFSTSPDEPAPVLVSALEAVAVQIGRTWVRQRAVAELEASEARFRAVTDTAHEAIISADTTGLITYANPAAAALFGRGALDLLGRPLTDLMPERLRAAHRAGFQRFLATRRPRVIGTVVEVAGLRADGSEFPLELSIAYGSTRDGEFFTGIVRDITERQRTEQFLRRALEREQAAAEQLRSLDDMKNQFLTAVSHEMRTPLASVLGIALTLDRKPDLPAEARREMLRQLATNADRLDHLLEDLLDVDRLTRGVVELRRTEEDVGAIVRRIVGKSGLAGRAVTIDVHDEPLVARVDVPKLERILEHLLDNAARHTPASTPVWVHAGRTAEGLLLGVDDAGPGVPPELRSAVFDAFRQGPALRPHAPGTGVGLALVARFADLHGGRAWVEERPGGGAAFRVLLP